MKQSAVDDINVEPVDDQRRPPETDQRAPAGCGLTRRPAVGAIEDEQYPTEPNQEIMRTRQRIVEEAVFEGCSQAHPSAKSIRAHTGYGGSFEEFGVADALLRFK